MSDTGCVNCGRECGLHPAADCKHYAEPSRWGRPRTGAIELEQKQYEDALAALRKYGP